jgi:lipopolysaccharide export system permease protein
MTVAVCTLVLMLGSVIKEILTLLVNRQASIAAVLMAIGLLIPFVLVFALPTGLLTATLLVFGRFSADQEMTAVRAGGISLVSLISPVLLLSVVMSIVCAFINLEFAPRCRVAYKDLLFDMGLSRTAAFLQEKTFITDFNNRMIYIDRVEGNKLKGVLVYFLKNEGGNLKVESYLRAEECTYQADPATRKVMLTLSNSWWVGKAEGRVMPGFAGGTDPLELSLGAQSGEKVKISDMTWSQLWREFREVEKRLTASPAEPKLSRIEMAVRLRQMEMAREDALEPIRVQIHRRAAFSFACIGFTLVGIPLGIRAHRRETSFGIAAALIMVIVYYSFFIIGQALETRPEFAPHLLVWAPNFFFETIGAVLLWRANRGL